ncbi:helix-turn-helix domain-containing protein [Xylophilus rhododendri]|uniref:Helix-turn-helix domain-containing protein n=1 Tax=Xylophilus rhododendri TaxID=2697032 RepID=A0A857JEF5_9BURK|nr:helix-turn-helix transcriptional regulator [Xylophilus rhododendri]QHJ01066.1 helix-turn-helix domain-containing protein [Xylophilus rhododendri]
MADSPSLASYLKDRRSRLDPAALGFTGLRRRTPGLRREEVAQRANISATWYTWLEQGRGGAPSAEVLDRIARALLLTEVEREHVFLLGLGRPPEVRLRDSETFTPRLQGVLDAMPHSPALVRNVTWDVIAWNAAAAAVLTDYGNLPPPQRNVLRLMFLSPHSRAAQFDWESIARYVVGVFRAEATRVGAAATVQPLVDELCRASPDFAAMWSEHDVRHVGEGVKRLRHAVLGEIALEFSSFAVDGRPDLSMLVYNPTTAADTQRIMALIATRREQACKTPSSS